MLPGEQRRAALESKHCWDHIFRHHHSRRKDQPPIGRTPKPEPQTTGAWGSHATLGFRILFQSTARGGACVTSSNTRSFDVLLVSPIYSPLVLHWLNTSSWEVGFVDWILFCRLKSGGGVLLDFCCVWWDFTVEFLFWLKFLLKSVERGLDLTCDFSLLLEILTLLLWLAIFFFFFWLLLRDFFFVGWHGR